MDFCLTDEQKQIKETVRQFAEGEIKPHLMEWDEAQTFPLETVKKLGELGMLGAIFPEQYGGAALSYVDYVNNDATLSIRTPASGLTLKRVTVVVRDGTTGTIFARESSAFQGP